MQDAYSKNDVDMKNKHNYISIFTRAIGLITKVINPTTHQIYIYLIT